MIHFETSPQERVEVKAYNSDGSYFKLSAVLNMTSDRTKVEINFGTCFLIAACRSHICYHVIIFNNSLNFTVVVCLLLLISSCTSQYVPVFRKPKWLSCPLCTAIDYNGLFCTTLPDADCIAWSCMKDFKIKINCEMVVFGPKR